MGILIGMDEAGYGPNLGPLVVTVTAWEVPGHPCDCDLWSQLGEVVSQSPTRAADHIHVADSKQVYSPSRGIGPLENGVLSALAMTDCRPDGFTELLTALGVAETTGSQAEPWFDGCDLPVPQTASRSTIETVARRWEQVCAQQGIRLKAIKSDVVLTERFNRLTTQFDSKGVALSRISLQLLRQVWNPDDPEPTQIIADKHGGRNRYDGLLSEVLDDRMIFRLQEGRQRSDYRVGSSEIRFQTKAEAHLPVALASMVCKYIRELAMTLFNNFWCERIPHLKPTKGYPVDARRFKSDIETMQSQLGITDEVLWRAR